MGIAKEVCRIAKLKSIGALGGAYEHNLRLKDIPNADERKTTYNIELTDRPQGKSYVDVFYEKINNSPWYKDGAHAIAKNAIYAAEFMLTFGHKATDQIDVDAWAKDNYQWLCEHFGGEQNVISAILHVDERTSHIHAIVMPMDEKGKLSYTKYLGGKRYRLSEVQDNYHEEVGQKYQLERGMKGSKATHQDIDAFYSMVNEVVAVQELPEPEQKTGLFKKGESAKEYQERIAPIVSHAQSVAVAKEKENELLKKRIADIEHLQDGVVPEDVYQETLKKCNCLEIKLEETEKREKKYHELAVSGQKKIEKLECSLQQKIADAVTKATMALQQTCDSLKKKYQETKGKLDTLSASHSVLEKKYVNLLKDYKALKSTAAHASDLQWENKLMYKLLRTLNQSHRIDKCREAHKNGKVSIEERMIYGTEKSQRENAQRNTAVQSNMHRKQSYDRD